MIELIKTPYETKGFENEVKSSYIQIKNWLTELKELQSGDNKSPCKNFRHINTCYISELDVAIEYYKTLARKSEHINCFKVADEYWLIAGWLRELRDLKIAGKVIKR